MPTIRATLPDGSAFNIDASGFATENTLNSMLRVLEQATNVKNTSKVQKENAAATNEASGALLDLVPTIDLTQDSFKKTNTWVDKAGKALDSFASFADQSAQVLSSMSFSGSDSHGKLNQLANVAGRVSESLSKITDGIPIISTLAKGGDAIVQGMSLVTQFVTGVLENLKDSQRSLYNSGVFFANGIDDAAKFAGEAGTTLGYLSRAAADSSEELRRSNGGAAEALTKTTKAFGILNTKTAQQTRSQVEQLYTLGYTQDEILSGIAKFNSTMDMAGRSMNTQQLADASMQYLVTMKELDRITGSDIQSRKAAAAQLSNELAYRQFLRGLNGEQAAATEAMITSMNEISPAFGNIAKTLILGGEVTDTNLAVISNSIPGYEGMMKDFRNRMLNGTLDVNEIPKLVSEAADVAKNGIDNLSDSLGGPVMLSYLDQTSGLMKSILDTLGPAYNKFDQVVKASDPTAANAQSIVQSSGELASAIAAYTNLEVEISNLMQQTAISITKSVIGLGTMLNDAFLQMLTTMGFGGDKYDPTSAIALEEQKRQADQLSEISNAIQSFQQNGEYNAVSPDGGLTPNALDFMSDEELAKHGMKRVIPEAFGLGYAPNTYVPLDPSNIPEVPQPDLPETAPAKPENTSMEITGKDDSPIAVTIADVTVWEDIRKKLDILNATNGQIVREMERSNTIAKQNGYASA